MKAYGILYVTAILLCYVYAAPKSSIEVSTNKKTNHAENLKHLPNIIGGKRAKITDYPYTVAVIEGTSHEGSAVVINRRWLLTSAWVALLESPKNILVRAGSNSAILGGQAEWVDKIIIHPNYTYDWSYDLALLKLKKPLKFNKYVRPIKISNSVPEQGIAALTGFGFTNTSQQYQYVHNGWLREADMSIIPYENCKGYYLQYPAFTKLSFCTAVTERKGPCDFDFGSPLVYKKKLIGIFSGTTSCADPNFPAVYTNVAKLKSWIHATVNHHSSQEEL